MAEEQLNVLWIITDEQRTDSLGCYGSPWARSPHLDGVARAGVRFENAIVQSPVCVPSRTCMMTGRYAHAFGVLECQHRELPDETPLTEPFVDAGYQVAGFGKYHCVDPRNPFPVHGPDLPGPDLLGHGGARTTLAGPPWQVECRDSPRHPLCRPPAHAPKLVQRYPPQLRGAYNRDALGFSYPCPCGRRES